MVESIHLSPRARARAKAQAGAVTVGTMTTAQLTGLAENFLRDGIFDAAIFCIRELKRRTRSDPALQGPRPSMDDPLFGYRAGIALKAAALVFLDSVPDAVDPIIYAPGLEIRLTRMETAGAHDG